MGSLIEVQTPFQNIKIDPSYYPGEVILYCDDAWQLDTFVEFKYHESLMTLPMVCAPGVSKVLVCGGGDGMAVREALRFPDVYEVTLVEIDPGMIKLFRDTEYAKYNGNSLADPKVRVFIKDALQFAKETQEKYDFICLDFPSPGRSNRDKNYPNLFSQASIESFIRLLKPHGVLALQASITNVRVSGVLSVLLRHGFFAWGYECFYNAKSTDSFLVASRQYLRPEREIPKGTRAITPKHIELAFSDTCQLDRRAQEYFSTFCHAEENE